MMQKDRILKSLRVNYAVSFIAALLVVVAFESGYLHKGALLTVLSNTAVYIMQVVTVMLTVILIPLAIKGFSNNLKKAKGVSEREFLKIYSKNTLRRVFLLFIAIIVSEFAYYGLNYEGALYCAILAYGSLIYSYPTKLVLEDCLQDLNN